MNKHKRFIELTKYISSWSKDRSTKVGCVIVGPANEIRTVGYNGFPRGVDDNNERRHERPIKYKWTEHAERNAIYNAARMGTPLEGCIIYLHWYPCTDCARAIIQSGITTIVCPPVDLDHPRWGEDFAVAVQMFLEAGIKQIFIEEE